MQRGPAYTEMSLFAQIDADGKLKLVNHLGIDLGSTPEQILSRLDDERISDSDVLHDGRHAHDHDYVTRVRDVDADTPARYNADPDHPVRILRLRRQAGGFRRASRYLPGGKAPAGVSVTNQPQEPIEIRRHILAEFQHLPVRGIYAPRYLRYRREVWQRHLPDDRQSSAPTKCRSSSP